MKDPMTEAALEAAALKLAEDPRLTLNLVHSNQTMNSNRSISWAKLSDPFKPEEIEWRAAQAGEGKSGPWVKVLAYVTARAIMDRLDEVVGPGSWRVSYRFVGKDQAAAEGVMCELAIKADGEWITKEDGADQTDVEAFKGGISSALKRAAVLWGIGRYLYSLEEGWGRIVDQGQGGHYAKTKEGKSFYWAPPALPEWALPSKQLKEDAKGETPKYPLTETEKKIIKTGEDALSKGELKQANAPAARPKASPKPNSSEGSKPPTPTSPTATSSQSPTTSSASGGKPATPSPSPFAKGAVDATRDKLNARITTIYRSFLAKYPNTNFGSMLTERYGVAETRLMTTAQISELVTFMEHGLNDVTPPPKKQGKPPTDTERKDLWDASKANGWTAEQMTQYLQAAFGVKSSKSLTREQFQLMSGVSPKVPFELAISEFKSLEDDVP